MLRAIFNTEDAAKLFTKLKIAVTDRSFDAPVEIAAQKSRADLILLTPKRWTGNTRKNWQVQKTGEGERLVKNDSKVMLWLEEGTGNAGTPTSHGGRIYPKTKRFLFIPLTASASIGGWQQGMKYGVDYVLAKSVRGIKAMKIVAGYRPKAAARLKEEMKDFLKKTLS